MIDENKRSSRINDSQVVHYIVSSRVGHLIVLRQRKGRRALERSLELGLFPSKFVRFAPADTSLPMIKKEYLSKISFPLTKIVAPVGGHGTHAMHSPGLLAGW